MCVCVCPRVHSVWYQIQFSHYRTDSTEWAGALMVSGFFFFSAVSWTIAGSYNPERSCHSAGYSWNAQQPWIWNACIIHCDCDLVLNLIWTSWLSLCSEALPASWRTIVCVPLIHAHLMRAAFILPLSCPSLKSQKQACTRGLSFSRTHTSACVGMHKSDMEGISACVSCDVTCSGDRGRGQVMKGWDKGRT